MDRLEEKYYQMDSVANYRGNYDFKCPNCKETIDDLMFSKQPTYCFKCSKSSGEKTFEIDIYTQKVLTIIFERK